MEDLRKLILENKETVQDNDIEEEEKEGILLNDDQERVLNILANSTENVFLTGDAGTGKSFVLDVFLSRLRNLSGNSFKDKFPVLASTGAAAVLIGGRTFHSFFGLGLMKGTDKDIVLESCKRKDVIKRLLSAEILFIDEISMLDGRTLSIAEEIAMRCRVSEKPWGGLRIVCSGDFFQLPPISRVKGRPDWAFLSEVWKTSNFVNLILKQVVRTKEKALSDVLNYIRVGEYNRYVYDFLHRNIIKNVETYDGTRIFPFRKDVSQLNLERLSKLESKEKIYNSHYVGDERYEDSVYSSLPIDRTLHLKENAIVMIRKNSKDGLFVNGTTGKICGMSDSVIDIETPNRIISLTEHEFEYQNGSGRVVASVFAFPLSLAWASTIHKIQGATLDSVCCNLCGVWESGQTYVAVSRVRDEAGFSVESWSDNCIKADTRVLDFYSQIKNSLYGEN